MNKGSMLLLSTVLLGAASVAQAATISPFNMNGWKFFDDLNGANCLATSVCSIQAGPGAVPAGVGSARLETTINADRPTVGALLENLSGQKLANISKLEYSTFVETNLNVQAIALQFNVDKDVTDYYYGYQGRLVFEPYWNPDQGAVTKGVWQTWNAQAGKWWLSSSNSRDGNVFSNYCNADVPCTFAQLLQYFPNMGILDVPEAPNTLLKAGSYWGAFKGNVDQLVIGISGADTVYNFEPGPTTKEACYNNGWVGFFKNQGQCVSHFVSAAPQ